MNQRLKTNMEPSKGPESDNIVRLPKLPDSAGQDTPAADSSQQQRSPEPVSNIERALGNERILHDALSRCLEHLRTASGFMDESIARGPGIDVTHLLNARVPLNISLNKVQNVITLLERVNLPPSTRVLQDLHTLKDSIKESLTIFAEPSKGRLEAASQSPDSKGRVRESCNSLLKTITDVELLVGRQKIRIARVVQELGLSKQPPGLPPHEQFPRESA